MLPPSCSIQFRPDLQVLIVRWLTDAPLPQLQADRLAVLAAATEHRAARWLLDVRRTAQEPELAAWAVHDCYPRAARELLPRPPHVAALASPGRMGTYQPDAHSRQTLAYARDQTRPYRLQLFGDEGAAVQRLLTQAAQ